MGTALQWLLGVIAYVCLVIFIARLLGANQLDDDSENGQ